MKLPPPPKLKTTIIQLNKDIDPEDNNYEVLSNDYATDIDKKSSVSGSFSVSDVQPRKKRRRSSSTVGEDEMARRRTETKQLHSLIEKRRRIKINREFEALKSLIPACRAAENGARRAGMASNNANKIDGMYKLTILKTAVEYILYLHHVLKAQHDLVSSSGSDSDFDVSFADIPLDVNQYRNIDQEFDFTEFLSRCISTSGMTRKRATSMPKFHENSSSSIAETEEEAETQPENAISSEPCTRRSKPDQHSDQLLTPQFTPEFSPILSMLSKHSEAKDIPFDHSPTFLVTKEQAHQFNTGQPHSSSPKAGFPGKPFSFATSSQHTSADSTSTSPFTIPLKSSLRKSVFTLPDPALTSTSASYASMSSMSSAVVVTATDSTQNYPRKMYFKQQVPPQNQIAHIGCEESNVQSNTADTEKLEDASKMLLALRKPSIGQLLN